MTYLLIYLGLGIASTILLWGLLKPTTPIEWLWLLLYITLWPLVIILVIYIGATMNRT